MTLNAFSTVTNNNVAKSSKRQGKTAPKRVQRTQRKEKSGLQRVFTVINPRASKARDNKKSNGKQRKQTKQTPKTAEQLNKELDNYFQKVCL